MTRHFNSVFVSLSLLIVAGSVRAQWNGEILAWGRNHYGQCSVPYPNTGFVMVAAGGNHSLGLKEDGSIRAWGQNNKGQCNVPSPNSEFVAIAAGTYHSLGLKEDGSIVAWGSNDEGQCSVPAPNTGFVAIAAGAIHSLGLKEDGSIVPWGDNTAGQCSVPPPNSGFSAVAAGWGHSLGLKENGTSVEDDDPPGNFLQIQSVSPNPFSTGTSVVFNSPGLSGVTLDVCDTTGRLVNTRNLGSSPAGSHSATWDGRDSH
jgi:hypothetical protein